MRPLAFCIPGDLSLPTGGYRYDREVLARLPGLGFSPRHIALAATFPFPSAADIDATSDILNAVDPDTPLLIDGLALGALPPALIAELPNPVVALVHHPLGLESGLDAPTSRRLITNEAAVLTACDHVIVTSRTTREMLIQSFAIPLGKITIAEPGTLRQARSAPHVDGPLRLIAVGAVVPRKAFPLLVEALEPLSSLDWHLTIAGSMDRDRMEARRLSASVLEGGVADKVTLLGSLPDAALSRLLSESHVFVSASLYEGYGMALAEALACGLSIVTTTGGAASETIPDGVALKVAPSDRAAMTDALRRLMTDASLRQTLAEASWKAGQSLPTWDDTARQIADTIRTVTG